MSKDKRIRPWLSIYPETYLQDLEIKISSGVDHFRSAVEKNPERPAIYYFSETFSYKQLDEMSDSIACALSDLSVIKGDRVALLLQNIPQFIIAQYGAWKVGAIIVPINPMYKEKELSYYFRDANVKVLITQENLFYETAGKVVKKTGVEHVISTSELDFLGKRCDIPKSIQGIQKKPQPGTLDFMDLIKKYENSRPPDIELSSNDIAFLTYTSGTTGPPKGAMNSHGNVVHNSEVYCNFWQLETSDVILGVAPLFHITGMIAHVTTAIAAGLPLVLFYRFDASITLEMIERWEVTCTAGAITVFIALLNDPSLVTRRTGSLKKVYSGGAPVIPAVVEQFEKATGAYIHNLYGLTESTSPTHMVPLGTRAPVDPSTGALSIGVPIQGHYAKIMDLEDPEKELSPGETGELVIKGPGIVPGYWKKPEETAYAIRNGWLYTGDVGTMDNDGWFYILDRKKDMIIASGFKVWPREVEDCLYLHPAVREAAVVGVQDSYRGETVKAFVALREGKAGSVTEQEIINFCKERLAAYKYPRLVEFVTEIPKTQTGKFLRRALR